MSRLTRLDFRSQQFYVYWWNLSMPMTLGFRRTWLQRSKYNQKVPHTHCKDKASYGK